MENRIKTQNSQKMWFWYNRLSKVKNRTKIMALMYITCINPFQKHPIHKDFTLSQWDTLIKKFTHSDFDTLNWEFRLSSLNPKQGLHFLLVWFLLTFPSASIHTHSRLKCCNFDTLFPICVCFFFFTKMQYASNTHNFEKHTLLCILVITDSIHISMEAIGGPLYPTYKDERALTPSSCGCL